ncbi:hypothetical protein CO174_00745 [Candidatus Uhrbacteria bacterium CG_4_9_14_3_um_filter_50_9]|uniref:Uncharacterized protein n=1 Tax=Candidatus Uhrbacteria bacterium CG_4_9_14_3_um_filter_50_9 TaxID=1975035 RepID=A0A2M7XE63_9BACT|nr:MAG: hypothetical protein CO174_00745 [Candidatus Uhrbacteria bacterium CG_4_9_14_3_um_filter_50_9]
MNLREHEHARAQAESEQRLKVLADAAEQWKKEVDLKRYPSLHISKALQGIPEGRERDRLFGEVRKELNRREKKKRAEEKEKRELRADADDARRRIKEDQRMRDAYAHAKRNQVESDTGYDPTLFNDESNEAA